jgi:hypothetical protein
MSGTEMKILRSGYKDHIAPAKLSRSFLGFQMRGEGGIPSPTVGCWGEPRWETTPELTE